MKRLRIIQLNEREVGSIHYLMRPVMSLGRAPSNDIVINHKQVSRKHLVIKVDDQSGDVIVEDCGSANGAFINGDRIVGETAMVDGNTLTIGDIDFLIEAVQPDDENLDNTASTQFETHGTIEVDDFNSEKALLAHRNAELNALGLRNSDQDEVFDEVAQIAAAIFDVDCGFVSVVGQNTCFYKGAFGLKNREWGRSETPCLLVVEAHAPIWVGEMFADTKLLAMPFLNQGPSYRFYAGAPYCGPSGIVIGTVGVMSEQQRTASPSQLEALAHLAKCVERQILLQLEKKRAEQMHLRLVESESSYSDEDTN